MILRMIACLIACATTLVVDASPALAYDRRTHGLITERAFERSQAIQEYLRAVGLGPTAVLDPDTRTSSFFLSDYENDGTPLGWLVEGSIREDDYHTNLPALGCEPPRNPPTAIDRLRHHFYDPDDGRGLHVGPVTIGIPAPAWALGEQGRGFGLEDNQFTLLDARLYQLRALIESTPQAREQQTALLFRALGQVVHLLEDMAQPQHVRNDLHPSCDTFLSGRVIREHSWYEDYIEARVRGRRFRGRPTHALVINGYPPPAMPTFRSYFTHDDRRSGLADFASHNFFTAGTNLGGIPPCDGRALPPCRADAYRAIDVPYTIVSANGILLEGPVRLLRRTMEDPIAGTSIPDVAVTSRSIWDHHLERIGATPTFSLNVLNYDAISDVLLPRAAGYATGFLDDFFRGRLDASVQPAGEPDPTILKLVTRNASDTAVDGVLLVSAEDSVTRQRQSVLAPTGPPQPLGAVATGVVLANRSFPELLFRPPFPAEKYVVVYHGKRLGPRIEDPPTGAIGAVMAQVLGGPRVEAIVPQGERRLLRAVSGTFDLPPGATGLELMQWSDVDNHFVGITGAPLVTGRPAPDEVKLFRIERPARSVDVPLIEGADSPVVDATLITTAPFPYGLELSTFVDYVQRVRVRQPLLTYQRTMTLQWDDAVAGYRPVADTVGPPSLEVPVDETVTFSERFPVVLDREHLFGATATTPRPYFWRLLEVGQDARGRLLAVVEVELTRPVDADRTVVLKTRGEDCAALEPRGGHHVAGVFQAGGLVAVIDLERREALGTTAASLFAPSSTELAQVFPLLQVRRVVTQIGGPEPGVQTGCFDVAFPGERPDLPTEVAATIALPPVGTTAFAVPGFYRGDIDAVASTPVGITSSSSDTQVVYAVTDEANKVVRLVASSSALAGYLTLIREAVRMRPGTRLSNDLLLRFDRPEGIGEVRSVLVRWDPESPLGTRLALPGELDPGRFRLAAATQDAALLRVEDLFSGDVQTVLADLDAGTVRWFPGDLMTQFALLPPVGLYNVEDTHFHTLDTLVETALPTALAPGPVAAPALGAYHLIVRE
jgi:hypothetical protein